MTYQLNRPEPGTYRIRRAKGAVWVPVLIYRPCACTINGPDEHLWQDDCDRYPPLTALVDGWEEVAPMSVWNNCRPISRADYDHMVATHAWAREHSPDHPDANPTRPVNLGGMRSIF